MSVVIFIIGLILFVLLVVVHELGHAIVARRNGVTVEEFGIGFPPRFWSRKLRNGTLFSLNALPLGGFVRLKGEHDAAEGPGTYGGASLKAKTKILLAGVVMNWITAVLIFTGLALTGLPQLVSGQFTVASNTKVTQSATLITYVENGSPAARGGLEVGDQLVKLGDQKVTSAEQLTHLTQSDAGKKVVITYIRNGTTRTTATTLHSNDNNGQGYLGVSPADRILQRSTWSAPIVGIGLTVQLTKLTVVGLGDVIGNLFTGIVQSFNTNGHIRAEGKSHFATAGDNVSGPVGIFMLLKSVSAAGMSLMLYLIAVISLTLAIMNVLPIPALDGGRLFVTLVYRLRKKALTKDREEQLQGYGFAALMVLIILVTIVDVKRYF